MQDIDLFKKLIEATGLPESLAERELSRILSEAGKNAENLTIDDLRETLAEYLQEVLLAAKNEYSFD